MIKPAEQFDLAHKSFSYPPPEGIDGDGAEAVAEWLGLWAGVEVESGDEACADFEAPPRRLGCALGCAIKV